MFPLSLKTAAIIPLSLILPIAAYAQEAEPAPDEEAPAEEAAAEEAPAAEASASAEVSVTPPAVDVEPAPAVEPAPEAEPPVVEAEPAPVVEEAPVEEAAAEEAPAEEEPPAPSLLPLKVGTHTWSRFEWRQNYDELGVSRARFIEGDRTFYRARLTFETNPLQLTDKLKGTMYFAPQATGVWGTGPGGGTIGETALGIYQGYFKIASDTLAVKVGRFEMKYGDVLMIGNLDWHQSGRAFDGAHVSYKAGKALIDGFITQTGEGGPGVSKPFMGGDNYFWGLYAQLGGLIAEGMNLDLYALGKSAAATDVAVDDTDPTLGTTHVDGATFVTLGARAKQKIGMFDYRAEAGVQVGKTPSGSDALSKLAYQGDIEFGVSPMAGTRISLGGAIASGDGDGADDKNNAWDELYPTTHKWFGLMDVIGFRTNIASGSLRFKTKLAKSTILKMDGHVFARLEEPSLGRNGDSDFAGVEIDTNVVQKFGKFGYARGMYGIFLANKDHYGTALAAHYIALQGGLKF